MLEAISDFRQGFASHIKGIRFAFQHLSFMLLAAIPFLITLSLYILGFYIFTQYADDLLHMVWRIDAGESSKYIGWLYWAYTHIVKLFLYLIALAVMFYTFIVFSNILASPVYDHIVSKYEHMCYQPAHEGQTRSSAKGVTTVVKEEVKKAVLMLFIPLPLILIPVIGGVLGFLVAAAFIAWDYIDFSLSRDHPMIKDRIKVLWQHKFFLLGFGCPLLIPFIGLTILPFAILGSTRLYFHKMKGAETIE